MRKTIMSVAVVAMGAIGCARDNKLATPEVRLGELATTQPSGPATGIRQAKGDEEIASVLDVRVRPRLPARLAIARLASTYGDVRMEAIDRDERGAWEKTLEGLREITGVEPLGTLSVEGKPNFRALRLAAANMNCELLLVYMHASASVDNFNGAAGLYWTFVGLWLVPGSTREHKTVMEAVLLDCRSGAILGTASGSAHAREMYPAAFGGIVSARQERQTPPKAMKELQAAARAMLERVIRSAGAGGDVPTTAPASP
jgi:rhombotail lipoprotein